MKNCCFTGHRDVILTDKLKNTLSTTISDLIRNGTTDFFAGGAIGWDTICETEILRQKIIYPQIKLHLILPCPADEQTLYWNSKTKKIYADIICSADYVEICSEHYCKSCMMKRNQKLVDYADCCVCYYGGNKFGGTFQTLNMARKKEISIINLYPQK